MNLHDFIIIGAGPVGIAIALLLNKLGYRVTCYEGRSEISNDILQSYPIGINSRTLNCLSLIDNELETEAKNTGFLVDYWKIFANTKMVASLPSNSVYGTTRGAINLLLYRKAVSNKIKIIFNSKLKSIDLKTKQLTFQNPVDNSEFTIDSSQARIIACDGYNSTVRKQLEGYNQFTSSIIPWNLEFRPMFSDINQTAPNLDFQSHYVINEIYAATVKFDNNYRWSVVTSVGDHSPPHLQQLLRSNDPSESNIKHLREYLSIRATNTVPLFPNDQPLKDFFYNRIFKGGIVKANRLNIDEWILFLGDSAHAVIPPTGEGINSGLEDAAVLYNLLDSSSDLTTIFDQYNRIRYKDVKSLVDLAIYLNNNFIVNKYERGSRLMFLIVQTILKSCHVIDSTYEDQFFGPKSKNRLPYRNIINKWKLRKSILLPICRCIVYPIGSLIDLISLPVVLTARLVNSCKR